MRTLEHKPLKLNVFFPPHFLLIQVCVNSCSTWLRTQLPNGDLRPLHHHHPPLSLDSAWKCSESAELRARARPRRRAHQADSLLARDGHRLHSHIVRLAGSACGMSPGASDTMAGKSGARTRLHPRSRPNPLRSTHFLSCAAAGRDGQFQHQDRVFTRVCHSAHLRTRLLSSTFLQ